MIKFSPGLGPYYNDVEGSFPKFKYLFSARHPKSCINSWLKMMEGELFGGTFALESTLRYCNLFDVQDDNLQDLPNKIIEIRGQAPE